jgi:spore coat polysaccharide biosynthesis predicted glycosyltransferase SpsG
VGSLFLGHFDPPAERLLAQAGVASEAAGAETGSREDLVAVLTAVRRRGAKMVVLDSYAATSDYLGALNAEVPVLVVDDFAALPEYRCWAILNSTVCAKQLAYRGDAAARFLGPEFLPVRRSLRALRPPAPPPTGPVRRVLVTIGGFDRYDLTGRVVAALSSLGGNLAVRAVVGRSYENPGPLEALLGRCGPGSVLARQLPSLGPELAAADLCVCGGGMTKDESAYMAVPTIVMSQTNEQDQEAQEFARQGLAVDFGLGCALPEDQLRERLAAVIADRALQERLRRNSFSAFPADSTLPVARAIAARLAEGVDRA